MAKNKKSNWYKIERSRETRLWIGQILVPGATLGVTLWQVPEIRDFVKTKFEEVKWRLRKATTAMKENMEKES